MTASILLESFSVGDVLTGAIVIVGLMVVFLLGYLAYNFFSTKKQGYPLEERIENALLPYLHGIIVGAFEESQSELEDIEDAIENVDKEELARKLYDLLPDEIAGFSTQIIQSIFTVEQFTDMFLRVYKEVKIYYVAKKGTFLELFEKWTGK